MIDSKSLPASVLRAMHREPALRQPGVMNERIKRLLVNVKADQSPKQVLERTETPAIASEAPKQGMTSETPKQANSSVSFTILGQPMGKPRMTQRDKWAKRPCVLRYRAWADRARAAMPANTPTEPLAVSILAYFAIPKSFSRVKRQKMAGEHHRTKPDADNAIKCLDALFKNDACIARISIVKRWDDGNGPRMEIAVE